MPDIDFSRHVGLILAIPILLVLLVAAHLAHRWRPKRKPTVRERFNKINDRTMP